MPKTNPIVLWFYTTFHLRDDWGVRAVDAQTLVPMESFATPWMLKALWKYIVFNFKYSEYNVILTHYRYPEV